MFLSRLCSLEALLRFFATVALKRCDRWTLIITSCDSVDSRIDRSCCEKRRKGRYEHARVWRLMGETAAHVMGESVSDVSVWVVCVDAHVLVMRG